MNRKNKISARWLSGKLCQPCVEGMGLIPGKVIFRFSYQIKNFFCKNILHKKIRMAKFFRAKVSRKNGVNSDFKIPCFTARGR